MRKSPVLVALMAAAALFAGASGLCLAPCDYKLSKKMAMSKSKKKKM